MTKFNPEFITALAHGEQQAYEMLKEVSLTERLAIGSAVEEMRRTQNIIPMNNKMTIYERPASKYVTDEGIREAMQRRLDQEREESERQRKFHEDRIREQTKAAIERSRAGLPKNGNFSS